MHSFRVGGSLSESLAGTAVDEIMQLAGWRPRKMATSYIGPTTSDGAKGKRRRSDNVYDFAEKLPLEANLSASMVLTVGGNCTDRGKLRDGVELDKGRQGISEI